MPLLKSRLRWGAGSRGMKGYPKNKTETFTIKLTSENAVIEQFLTTTARTVETLQFSKDEAMELTQDMFPQSDSKNQLVSELLKLPDIRIKIMPGSFDLTFRYSSKDIDLALGLFSFFLKKQIDTGTQMITMSIKDIKTLTEGVKKYVNEGPRYQKYFDVINSLELDAGATLAVWTQIKIKITNNGATDDDIAAVQNVLDELNKPSEVLDELYKPSEVFNANRLADLARTAYEKIEIFLNTTSSMSNDGVKATYAELVVDAILSELFDITDNPAILNDFIVTGIPATITGTLATLDSDYNDQEQIVRLGITFDETDRNKILGGLVSNFGFVEGTETVQLSEFITKLSEFITQINDYRFQETYAQRVEYKPSSDEPSPSA